MTMVYEPKNIPQKTPMNDKADDTILKNKAFLTFIPALNRTAKSPDN